MSNLHGNCNRCRNRLAQGLLERSYTVGRPPLRFTPNQVDQSALLTVYWAVIMLVISVVLVVTFFTRVLLSTPISEIEHVSANKQDGMDPVNAFVAKVLISLSLALFGGCALSCSLDSEHPLPRALLLLM